MSHDAPNADAIPMTYRTGPSDPAVFADGPGTWVEATIAATPEAVWAAVTDIDVPAEFSEEFQGATWLTPGPELGARFVGTNKNTAIGEWQTESIVDRFEEFREFGWAVGDLDKPVARWCFRLSPLDDGVTLRFEVTLGPGASGLTMAIASAPDSERGIIRFRLGDLHGNMARTVEGIREKVEQ